MADATELWDQVDALERGCAFVDRSSWRKLRIAGRGARTWLGDLLTADIASLEPGPAIRSLLLTPTGRIRADVLVAAEAENAFLLVQDVDQPEPIRELLAPYVLSSAVELEDVTERLGLLVLAGDELVAPPRSALPAERRGLVERGCVELGDAAFELRRVIRGDPRMGVDFEVGALPAETGLDRVIDADKGCFLGQESVAKIRNLGHPPTVLRHLRSAIQVVSGTPVLSASAEVGRVTSSVPAREGGAIVLARVDWEAVEAELHTDAGPLMRVAAD
ncbi:MAG: CAF17-like 4Fe-4S cluster assembly/insertion protein YgfZ [Actinomycetota bacterium]